MSLQTRVEAWLYGLIAAAIGGGATAGTSWLGMAGAKAMGVDVPTLNFKALGIIFASGAVTNVLAYLKQSPLPKASEGDTILLNRADAPATPPKVGI